MGERRLDPVRPIAVLSVLALWVALQIFDAWDAYHGGLYDVPAEVSNMLLAVLGALFGLQLAPAMSSGWRNLTGGSQASPPVSSPPAAPTTAPTTGLPYPQPTPPSTLPKGPSVPPVSGKGPSSTPPWPPGPSKGG